jgi:hypothetical protein
MTGTPRPAAPTPSEVSVVVVSILLGVVGALFLTMAVIDIRGRRRRDNWVYLDGAADARQTQLARAAEAGSHPHLTLLPPVHPGS